MRRPEGPHAMSFGKECKRAMISKSGGRQGAAEEGAVGGVGGGGGGLPLGCFETRRFHVVLLLGPSLLLFF